MEVGMETQNQDTVSSLGEAGAFTHSLVQPVKMHEAPTPCGVLSWCLGSRQGSALMGLT